MSGVQPPAGFNFQTSTPTETSSGGSNAPKPVRMQLQAKVSAPPQPEPVTAGAVWTALSRGRSITFQLNRTASVTRVTLTPSGDRLWVERALVSGTAGMNHGRWQRSYNSGAPTVDPPRREWVTMPKSVADLDRLIQGL